MRGYEVPPKILTHAHPSVVDSGEVMIDEA